MTQFSEHEIHSDMPDDQITTVREVVDALGGPSSVAMWLGLEHASAVSNWIKLGCIPAGWHLRIFLELLRLGYQVDPVLFGLTDAETRHVTLRFRRPRARAKFRRLAQQGLA